MIKKMKEELEYFAAKPGDFDYEEENQPDEKDLMDEQQADDGGFQAFSCQDEYKDDDDSEGDVR